MLQLVIAHYLETKQSNFGLQTFPSKQNAFQSIIGRKKNPVQSVESWDWCDLAEFAKMHQSQLSTD